MAKVIDIYNYLDEIAPFSTQEGWDNSGMLVGDFEKEINCVAVVLDITPAAITTAKDLGAGLIVSHHPVIFKPQKCFKKGNIAYELAVSGISAICSHTCLDGASGGVNDVLAEKIGLTNIFPMIGSDGESSMVRIGDFNTELTPKEMDAISNMVKDSDLDCTNFTPAEFAAYIKARVGTGCVRYCKGANVIKTVAVCGGSGGSFINDVIASGADAFVTGDAGHHDFLDARAAGLTLVAAGHFNTEDPVIEPLARKLAAKFPAVKIIRLKQADPILSF